MPGSGTEENADAFAARVGGAMYENDVATRSLGIRLEAVGAGWARMSMEVGAHMLNGHGVCHGGLIFALADSAMAFASNSRNRVSVAQFCSVAFLRPGRAGTRLVAEAREQAIAGRTGAYGVEVVDPSGNVVATFSGNVRRLGDATII